MTNDFKNKQSSGARPPRLSPEEYAAKKKAEKEAIYQLLDNTALEVVQSPEKFKACGAPIIKRGNRKKYCEKCAGIAYKRQQAEYARKKRTESKNRG